MRRSRAAICIILFLCFTISGLAESVCVSFPAAIGGGTNRVTIDFEATRFLQPSDEYDHHIARASLCMAVAAFRSETITYRNSDSNIRAFFSQAGFENYESAQYEMMPTAGTIASAIASKTLDDGSVLIAVAISGQGYKNEWMGNFAVGGDETHSGFRDAAGIVYERLLAYLEEYNFDGRVRVWTAGFSRAAATANLFAARVLQSGLVEANDVFAYTFGTPSTTKTPIDYPQIHNICNSFDPVAFIPFSNWRYKKHGTTLYLPAAENDIGYYEKLQDARDTYESITGSTKGFASNVNANWLLSKLMELLYHILPESSFYSSAFQQTLIDTWATSGSIVDKIDFMVNDVLGNESLMNAVKTGSAGIGVLLAESLYNACMEIAGKRNGKWADLFTGATQLIHEHEPSIYLSWLLSTEDPAVLYDHPLAYTRLIYSADLTMTVEAADGSELPFTTYSRFTLNNQVYYAIPDGDYIVCLHAQQDTEGIIALRYHDIRSVSETLYTTEKMHYFAGDELVIRITTGGEYSLMLGETDVSLLNAAESGLVSIASELTLTGSNGIDELTQMTTTIVAMIIPHILAIVLILFYCLIMLISRVVFRNHNDAIEARKGGRVVLVLVAGTCTIVCGRHLFYFFSTLFQGAPDLENHTAIRAAELVGMGTAIYQITDAVMYAMLAFLAWRGRSRQRSRARGRRLAILFLLIKIMILFTAALVNTLTYYDICCVIYFFICVCVFIFARDKKLEKELRRRRIEHLRSMRLARKERRTQKAAERSN